MNVIHNMKEKLDLSWKSIIRPRRAKYNIGSLLSESFSLQKTQVNGKRVDFSFKNSRKEKIYASLFEPDIQNQSELCVVYCHTHAGCRVEGLNMVQFMVGVGISSCVFDFSGNGWSEGQYVSLGFNESEDISDVLNELRKNHGKTEFVLWGRSMGAVSTLLYSYKYRHMQNVKCLVLDSPFANFSKLISGLVKRAAKIPEAITKIGLAPVTETIRRKLHFDLMALSPEELVGTMEAPAFFIQGIQDLMTPIKHVFPLYKKYRGPKEFCIVSGGHNTDRCQNTMDKAWGFIGKYTESLIEEEAKVCVVHKTSDPFSFKKMQENSSFLDDDGSSIEARKSDGRSVFSDAREVLKIMGCNENIPVITMSRYKEGLVGGLVEQKGRNNKSIFNDRKNGEVASGSGASSVKEEGAIGTHARGKSATSFPYKILIQDESRFYQSQSSINEEKENEKRMELVSRTKNERPRDNVNKSSASYLTSINMGKRNFKPIPNNMKSKRKTPKIFSMIS